MTKEERKKAIDALKISAPIHALTEEEFNDYIQTLNKVMDWLEQEPKAGHREYNDIYDHYLCGNCKTIVMDYDNFCPNCGARMVEPQESENKDADKKCTYKETGCGSCKRQLDCPIEADRAESADT